MWLDIFRRPIAASLLLAVMLAGAGCDNKQYKEQVAKFRKSVDTAGAAVGVYYSEMNQFERDLYLLECKLDAGKNLSVRDQGRLPADGGDGSPAEVSRPGAALDAIILHGPFPPESIAARTDAIALLGIYGRRLAELAGTDAPTRFADGATVLGENLDRLNKTFAGLRGDPTAPQYVGPIGTIIGVVGRMMLERRRDAALTAAINEGAPAVRSVLRLLENDLNDVISPLRRTGTLQILAGLVGHYNDHRTQMDSAQRRAALDEVRRAAESYELVAASNPAALVESMRAAHDSLVKYANSQRKPQNLAELVSTLEDFSSRAQQVASAVARLRDLRRTDS